MGKEELELIMRAGQKGCKKDIYRKRV